MVAHTLRLYTEWGINLNFKGTVRHLRSRLWFNVFLKVAAIFAAFVVVLTIANGTMLLDFFCFRQKNHLIAQIGRMEGLDLNDAETVTNLLSEINEEYNFDAEIYNSRGRILFTTHGRKMMDFAQIGRDNFFMTHEEMVAQKTEILDDKTVFCKAKRRFDNEEYLLCYREIESGIYAELRIQVQMLKSAVNTANEFIVIVASLCFILSVVWIFIFARKFSRPIARMNEITHDMTRLDFSRKLDCTGSDEIGQLANSINRLSDSLSAALYELECTNVKLRDEIELERQLDVMRKAFVANVSHELKTPISIISGYAEGLKLNVNSASREEYCDTIIDESHRMNRLVISILELSRYESGQMPTKAEEFDIYELADKMLTRIFADSSIVTLNCIKSGTRVFADTVQTEQVLKAYLENARSHTPDGGIVRVSEHTDGEYSVISVHNTGSHIDEEVLPHIWESFYRGDSSHKRDESRFGLGLSIVSAIVKNNGCSCGVYNTDSGVCFWFTCKKV